ncbi:alpha-ketoglutarate-dependent dioxygenase AlkB [Enterovirga aerilata]|uniref:Alpha-ketoglutarate-dependent dioxygenase AlkB n=1 Tax=Enterovirga aerilata TaxID=2730920 RepID=A0A849I101_9HYPH|nr:alpha-ketoglutarate-dependent dioxygenase AlkB [Enterovirga sp. DB1703]NNM73446.1 alpha-ketoglutarate-dependent dioxygenase AlkB [Enterovirga sp. DB1703]
MTGGPDLASARPAAQRLDLGPGLTFVPGYLDRLAQERLLAEIRDLARRAPLFTPRMPRTDQPFSVRMTNCGPLGWVSDVSGYRYQPTHPQTGEPWPAMPESLLDAWNELARFPHPPEACLINFYGPGARMGLHQDKDEGELAAPVVSLSLGATALFRIGGLSRRDRTRSIRLSSGDAFVFGGAARLVFHGIDRILPETSDLIPGSGRVNLTLRRVTPAPAA